MALYKCIYLLTYLPSEKVTMNYTIVSQTELSSVM